VQGLRQQLAALLEKLEKAELADPSP